MEYWNIVVIDNIDGVMFGDVYVLSCEDKDIVIETLKQLKEEKQDMDLVYIYPPESNIRVEELI